MFDKMIAEEMQEIRMEEVAIVQRKLHRFILGNVVIAVGLLVWGVMTDFREDDAAGVCVASGGVLFADVSGEWWCLTDDGRRIPGPWEQSNKAGAR